MVIMDAHISRGAVGDKKKWLQNAFQSTIEEEDDTCSSFSGYVKSDVGRSVRSYPRFNRQGAQTEIITDSKCVTGCSEDPKIRRCPRTHLRNVARSNVPKMTLGASSDLRIFGAL